MVRSMGSFRCGIRETFTQGRSYVASARAPSCTAGAGAGVGAGSSSMGSAISTALHTRSCAPHAPQGFPRPSGWSPGLADKPLGRVRTAALATRYGSRCAVRACAAATQPRTTIVAACSARPTDLCDAVMPRYGCREFQQRGNSCICSNLNSLGHQNSDHVVQGVSGEPAGRRAQSLLSTPPELLATSIA